MIFGFVDEHRGVWPVRMMCRVLGVSASGYYAWRTRPESRRSREDRGLLAEIRDIHADSGGVYGSPRIHVMLRSLGRAIGRNRVARLMRAGGLRGLAALPRRVRTTDSRHSYPIVPNRIGRNSNLEIIDGVSLSTIPQAARSCTRQQRWAASLRLKPIVVVTSETPKLSTRLSVTCVPTVLIRTTASQYDHGT
jgi:hypothetical protein